MYDYSYLLNKLGGCSTSQIIVLIYVTYGNLWAGYINVLPVFVAYTPEKRCKVPPLDDPSVYPNLTNSQILNYTTPIREDEDVYDTCYRYGYNLSSCTGDLSCVNISYPKVSCDHGYEYDVTVMKTTTVAEYNLVCDRLVLNSVSNAIFYVGMLIGGLIAGSIADNYGRQKCIIVGLVIYIGCFIANAFSVNLEMYIVFRMLYAVGYNTQAIGYIVFMNEQFVSEWRTVFNGIVNGGKVLGITLVSLIAFYYRTWRSVTLFCGLGMIPFLLATFIIGESPRWLLNVGKTQQAVEKINLMAKINKVEITNDDWDVAKTLWEKTNKGATDNDMKRKTFLDLFRNFKMGKMVINLMFNWFCCSFIYFGISINAGALSGNVFINNFLNGIMELAAFIILIFTLDRIGRRRILITSHFIAGFGLLISMLITLYADPASDAWEAVSKTFAFLAKAGSSAAFAIVYQITNELFPTSLRSNGLGACSMIARIGGIIAMFLIDLQAIHFWLPNTFFGVFGVLAGITTFLIPETNGLELPESINDALYMYENWRDMQKKRRENDHNPINAVEDGKTLKQRF